MELVEHSALSRNPGAATEIKNIVRRALVISSFPRDNLYYGRVTGMVLAFGDVSHEGGPMFDL
jgi:hypothetical protein